jgi:signal transduction histidine kinase
MFLLGAGTALAFPSTAVHARSTDQWDLLGDVAPAIDNFLRSALSLGNYVNQRRLLWHLRKLYRSVTDILDVKMVAWRAVHDVPCAPPFAARRGAVRAQRLIQPLMKRLAVQVDLLAGAAGPPRIGSELRSLADGLRSLGDQGSWMSNADRFCNLSQSRKKALLQEAEASLKLVQECRIRLDRLINRLQGRVP